MQVLWNDHGDSVKPIHSEHLCSVGKSVGDAESLGGCAGSFFPTSTDRHDL